MGEGQLREEERERERERGEGVGKREVRNWQLATAAGQIAQFTFLTISEFIERDLFHGLLIVHRFISLPLLARAAQPEEVVVSQEDSCAMTQWGLLCDCLSIHKGSRRREEEAGEKEYVGELSDAHGRRWGTNLAPFIGVMKSSFSTISMMQCSLAIPSPLSWMSCGGCTSARPTRVTS